MNQIVCKGWGSLKEASSIISDMNAKKIFLVTGESSFSLSGAKSVLEKLLTNCDYVCFSKKSDLLAPSDIEEGALLAKKYKSDVVLAVGGGGVIDLAKSIALLSQQTSAVGTLLSTSCSYYRPALPIIAIPTTAGSGSESTSFSAVYYQKTKYSLSHKSMLPLYVVLDPSLTEELSKEITAITGMDALCQAIESYWSTQGNTESQTFASQAIRTIMQFLKESVNEKTKRSREKMLYAANMAGKAINISKTTGPHAISYAYTIYFKVPHGHAVALSIIDFLKINSRVENAIINDPRGKSHVEKNMKNLYSIIGGDTLDEVVTVLENLLSDIGLTTNLADVGVCNINDVELILNNINEERLKNNPVKIDLSSFQSLLYNRLNQDRTNI